MKWIIIFSLLSLTQFSAFGQTPEKMSYQALIRDNAGILLENSNVNLKVVLRQGSTKGEVVYEETHKAMTNKNGLLSLEIGTGAIGKGNFKEINWAKGPFYIESHLDPNGNYQYKLNGISEVLSVPYALHAKSADSFTGTISPTQLPDFYTADEVDRLLIDMSVEKTITSNFSGDYRDLINRPALFSGNYSDLQNKPLLFSGSYADLRDKPELYNKTEIDKLFEGIEITGGSSFSGFYDDLQNKPELYNKTEIDNLIQGIEPTGSVPQTLSLENSNLTISGGNSILFENWDTNAADDFSGIYDDLQNKPEIYNKTEIDNLIQGIETTGSVPQTLSLEEGNLTISGGNSISFENWDTNATDDFSGIYDDLQNKPVLFSGLYNDLQEKPELYNKTEIDNLIQGIEITGSVPQTLSLAEGNLTISEGNSITFENWDTNAADDFSGIYDDLQNKPILFSGLYNDLQEKPELYDKTELYNKTEIDNLIQGIETTGSVPQTLSLENSNLTISGGNSILFENWDTNAADDFSGIYDDLQNKPEIYNKIEIDNLIQGIETTGSVPQTLSLESKNLTISEGNSISFENWDNNAADDFSGIYDDLQNKPILFSGLYNDLQEKPELYNKTEIDNLIQGIETTGSVPQTLSLINKNLTISEGNSISFDNWDTNAADDFSGIYDDLQNKPVLFSGLYNDLQEKPELYNKTEIDNLIQGIETTGSVPQTLSLINKNLTISEGNSISFDNWDTNAADDFSGIYDDLQNKPLLFSGLYKDLQEKPEFYIKTELYNKTEIDNLIQGIEATGTAPQSLSLENRILTISEGNSISFENWDTNVSDDFDGKYTSLTGAPKVYTQAEVDAIKASILAVVKENYSPKARVVTFSSSRNVMNDDVNNTVACTSSATLTITSDFAGMKVGDIINLEVQGTTLTVKGATGVVINGKSAGSITLGNNEIYRGGLIRKTANNSYIVL